MKKLFVVPVKEGGRLRSVKGKVATYQYEPGKPLAVYPLDADLLVGTGHWAYHGSQPVTMSKEAVGRLEKELGGFQKIPPMPETPVVDTKAEITKRGKRKKKPVNPAELIELNTDSPSDAESE